MKVFTSGVIAALCSISTSCLPVYGQNWQDEEHVWNEEKGRFEVHNKAHGRVDAQPQKKTIERHFDDVPWGRYLSKSVRNGQRPPTSWEIAEAQRKLWAKEVMAQRAMAKSEQRRQLIAYRKATGWYGARRNGNHNAISWPMQMHMSSVNRYMGGGGYGY